VALAERAPLDALHAVRRADKLVPRLAAAPPADASPLAHLALGARLAGRAARDACRSPVPAAARGCARRCHLVQCADAAALVSGRRGGFDCVMTRPRGSTTGPRWQARRRGGALAGVGSGRAAAGRRSALRGLHSL